MFYRTNADTVWKIDTMTSISVSWFMDSIPELQHDSLIVDYYLTVEDFATNKSRDPVLGLYSFLVESEVGNVGWTGKDKSNKKVASGIYFYIVQTSDYTATKKMYLVR